MFQGRRKQYGQYGHGLARISQILLKLNHVFFKKQQKLLFKLNSHTKYQFFPTFLCFRDEGLNSHLKLKASKTTENSTAWECTSVKYLVDELGLSTQQ